MATYLVPHDGGIRGSYHHDTFGEITFDFSKGKIIPKSEQDEFALEYLASLGQVERTRDEPESPAARALMPEEERGA